MRAMDIIAAEHRNMRLVSDALAALGARFATGTADGTALHTVELIAEYFETYSDRFHHKHESDVLFPLMRARSDRGAEMLDQLDRNHRDSHRELARLRFLADHPNRLETGNLKALAEHIRAFRDGFETHLRIEEEQCFPLAREVLTSDDWKMVEVAFAATSDPLDHENPVEAVALLKARITQLLPSPLGLGGTLTHAPATSRGWARPVEPTLAVEAVTSGYGRNDVLHGVSLRIMPGQLVALVGANGAGKTTLLRCISGVQPVSGGSISFRGAPIARMTSADRVRAGLCQVPEGRHVFAPMTIEDNLRLGAYTRPAGEIDRSLEEVYRLFPVLQERRHQPAGVLSGGQQQMVALGRALMGNPKLLLLDEPSMGLAPLIVAEIFRIVRMLRDSGVTILLVEQNARAALSIADHAYVMETGRITLEGPGADLLRDDDVRKAYLGL